MPIDKRIYDIPEMQNTDNTDARMATALDVNIPEDIVPPDYTETPDGGAEFDFGGTQPVTAAPTDFYANLAESLDEDSLQEIGSKLLAAVEADKESRKDWEQIVVDGMKELGFKIKDVEQEIFEDSCTVTHPLLAEAIVTYQSKARSQILPPDGPVDCKVLGGITEEKRQKANRVREFLNYQIMDQIKEYDPEHDRLLFHQGFGGSAFSKMYYDTALKRPSSRFISSMKFIINYDATSLESAYRYAEQLDITANDMRKYVLSGFYRDVALPAYSKGTDPIKDEIDRVAGQRLSDADDEQYCLYEVHTYLALDEADDRTPEERDIGLELPYIVTINADDGTILAIRRNWKQNDPDRNKRVWYVHWPFIPGFGFYGYGYIHLIGGLARASTVTLRQLLDAGQFANMQGGFKAHGLRVVGNNEPLGPGEWRDVQAPGMDISKALLPIPYKEPSSTLASLLEFMVGAAQRFADSTQQVVSESTNYGPVGTTMALLEHSGRMFTAIHERLFAAQKAELDILVDINSETMPDTYPYQVVGADRVIARQDFTGGVDVVPVTDPRAPTAAHRIAIAQARLAIAGQFPQQHNIRELLLDMHESLGTEDATRYLAPPPTATQPADPITENQYLLAGQPTVSAPYQDHISHIKVHASLLDNPLYSKNPNVISATMAHIQEHLAQNYKAEMQKLIGQMPQAQGPLPPQVENAIAQKASMAVDQLKKNTMLNGGVQDPTMVLKMAEQKLKEAELALEKQDLALKDQQHQQDILAELRKTRMQLASQERQLSKKLAVDVAIAKMTHDPTRG